MSVDIGFKYFDGTQKEWDELIDILEKFTNCMLSKFDDTKYPYDRMMKAQTAKIKGFVNNGGELGKAEGPVQIIAFTLYIIYHYKMSNKKLSLKEAFTKIFAIIPPCHENWIKQSDGAVEQMLDRFKNNVKNAK
jgi:hypothetical protein